MCSIYMLEEEYVCYKIGIILIILFWKLLELIIDILINLIKHSYKALF